MNKDFTHGVEEIIKKKKKNNEKNGMRGLTKKIKFS